MISATEPNATHVQFKDPFSFSWFTGSKEAFSHYVNGNIGRGHSFNFFFLSLVLQAFLLLSLSSPQETTAGVLQRAAKEPEFERHNKQNSNHRRAFIAIADRPVADFLPVYHYSLQYWECNSVFAPLNHTAGFMYDDIIEKCPDATKVASMELLARGEERWKVWASRPTYDANIRRWAKVDVVVSEVVYSDRSDCIMPILEGDIATVRNTWQQMVGVAKSYPWAEQGNSDVSNFKTNRQFANWPHSLYNLFGTNSKTFVAYTLKESGLKMVEMDGLHPGDISPNQNSIGDWRLYPEHKPWKTRGRYTLSVKTRGVLILALCVFIPASIIEFRRGIRNIYSRMNNRLKIASLVIFFFVVLSIYLYFNWYAFFGDPIPMDDHAERAVSTALDMQRKVAELRDEWLHYGQELGIGIGINTGYMTVGNIGSDMQKDYTVIGNQVNVAARLESLAKAGQILISHRTYSRVKSLVDTEAVGEIHVKGIYYPILTYNVKTSSISAVRKDENTGL